MKVFRDGSKAHDYQEKIEGIERPAEEAGQKCSPRITGRGLNYLGLIVEVL